MKLSEAIRLGAMLRPHQAFGKLFDGPDASCAMGAAAEAIGVTSNDNGRTWSGRPLPEWQWTSGLPVACPAPSCNSDWHRRTSVGDLVIHLNNEHRWTRERIADWIATIEPKESEGADATEHNIEALSAAHAQRQIE